MKDKKHKASGYGAGATTLVAAGTHVIGEIRFRGNLEIEGKVTGNIVADDDGKARVRILQSGEVRGEVRVPSMVVNGLVEGDLFVTQQIELASKAVVEGNVHYELIEIEKGAQVNGNFIRDAVTLAESASSNDYVESEMISAPEPVGV